VVENVGGLGIWIRGRWKNKDERKMIDDFSVWHNNDFDF